MIFYQDMENILKDLQQLQGKPAVSLFIKTHRTFPDNEKDPIALKNQLKIAEEHLKQQHGADIAKQVIQQIQQETRDLNPNYNLDTLAIFATPQQAKVLRFPFNTAERVIVGEQFAVRDLLRNMASAVHYYAVVVTREKGRLIEATDDRVIHEFTASDNPSIELPHGPFPVVTDSLATTSVAERASNEDNYLRDFLNRIDKNVQAIRTQHQLPIIVVGDKRNIGFYKDVCDHPNAIMATVDNVTHLNDGSAQHIIDCVQPALQHYQQQRQTKNKQAIQSLYGTQRARTDTQEIYRAIIEGNASTLYVRQGYVLHGSLDAEQRKVTLSPDSDTASTTSDIVDTFIELVNKHGGQVIFVQPDMMQDCEAMLLETRY